MANANKKSLKPVRVANLLHKFCWTADFAGNQNSNSNKQVQRFPHISVSIYQAQQ